MTKLIAGKSFDANERVKVARMKARVNDRTFEADGFIAFIDL